MRGACWWDFFFFFFSTFWIFGQPDGGGRVFVCFFFYVVDALYPTASDGIDDKKWHGVVKNGWRWSQLD